MKVVILAGGFGTRISEESQYKPKPMVEIGGKPIFLYWRSSNATGKVFRNILLTFWDEIYKRFTDGRFCGLIVGREFCE
jgi:NDP-sugar pyrophosphorylase family protein